MKLLLTIYHQLAVNPERGAVSGGLGYLLAIKAPALTDQDLKIIASWSAVVTFVISFLTLMSLLVRMALWCHKTVVIFIVKLKKSNNHES